MYTEYFIELHLAAKNIAEFQNIDYIKSFDVEPRI